MATKKDPYEVLGVNRGASDAEIKQKYRELVKKYHPDRYKGHPLEELAEEKMQEINEAYAYLSSSNRTSYSSQSDSRGNRPFGSGSNGYGNYGGNSGGYGGYENQRNYQNPYQNQQNPYQGYYGGSSDQDYCQAMSLLCCMNSCLSCCGGDCC